MVLARAVVPLEASWLEGRRIAGLQGQRPGRPGQPTQRPPCAQGPGCRCRGVAGGQAVRAASTRSGHGTLLTRLGGLLSWRSSGLLCGSHFLPALQRGGSKQNIAPEAPWPPGLQRAAYRPVHPLPLARTRSCNPSLPCRGGWETESSWYPGKGDGIDGTLPISAIFSFKTVLTN